MTNHHDVQVARRLVQCWPMAGRLQYHSRLASYRYRQGCNAPCVQNHQDLCVIERGNRPRISLDVVMQVGSCQHDGKASLAARCSPGTNCPGRTSRMQGDHHVIAG